MVMYKVCVGFLIAAALCILPGALHTIDPLFETGIVLFLCALVTLLIVIWKESE